MGEEKPGGERICEGLASETICVRSFVRVATIIAMSLGGCVMLLVFENITAISVSPLRLPIPAGMGTDRDEDVGSWRWIPVVGRGASKSSEKNFKKKATIRDG